MTTIRHLTLNDALSVYKEVAHSRPHLKNLIWSENATLESVTQFIDFLIKSPDRELFGMFHNDKFCGCVEIRYKNNSAEIGYWLGFDFRGQGILQDGLKQLKTMLSLDTTAMTAKVKLNNIKSYTILHSIFDMEKTNQDDVWIYLSNIRIVEKLKQYQIQEKTNAQDEEANKLPLKIKI